MEPENDRARAACAQMRAGVDAVPASASFCAEEPPC